MGKILLADDSAHAQRMGAKILTAEGHQVATVSNGQAAIKMLSDFAPDLIVADIFMPGKTGYELCESIKSDPKLAYIPVLLLVGKMEPYDAAEGKRVKADGVVTKPLESSDLVAVVHRLLAEVKKPAPSPPPPPPKPAAAEEPDEAEQFPEGVAALEPAPPEMVMAAEPREEPVSAFGDLLEATPSVTVEESPGAEPAALEVPALEALPLEPQGEFLLETLVPTTEFGETPYGEPAAGAGVLEESSLASPADAGLELAPAYEFLSPPVPAPVEPPPIPPVWMAEAAPVTEDDKKLFEPGPPAAPDWSGLMAMAQEEEKKEPLTGLAPPGGGLGLAAESSPNTEPPAVALPSFETFMLSPEPEGVGLDSAPGAAFAAGAGEEAVLAPALASEPDEMAAPKIAPVDPAMIEQIVRDAVEEMMPQIVDRIVRAAGITLQKEG